MQSGLGEWSKRCIPDDPRAGLRTCRHTRISAQDYIQLSAELGKRPHAVTSLEQVVNRCESFVGRLQVD
jgi:hypothetical protein